MLKELKIDVVTGEETRVEFTPEELTKVKKKQLEDKTNNDKN